MSNATEAKRRPDGSTFHLLAVPQDPQVNPYIPPEISAKLAALSEEYNKAQTEVVPGLIEGIGQVHSGASMLILLRAIIDDAESGQHSEFLQRSHDSKRKLKKWRPVFEQIQSQLIEIEHERNAIVRTLADELSSSKDEGTHRAGFLLSLWLSSVS